jgi:hypothetical protein
LWKTCQEFYCNKTLTRRKQEEEEEE